MFGILKITKTFDNKDTYEEPHSEGFTDKDKEPEDISFEIRITGPNGFDETTEIKVGITLEYKNLYYGKYTVVETGDERFTVEYLNNPATLTDIEPEAEIIVENTVTDGYATRKIFLTKFWKDGPERLAEDITVKLSRQSGDGTVTELNLKPEVTKVNDYQYRYTFENLTIYDAYGYKYIYSIEEEVNVDNYEEGEIEESGEGWYIVTNTYKSPLTEELIGTKVWVNENPFELPKIFFELWRRTEGVENSDEKVADKVEVVDKKVNFGQQDETDSKGRKYIYYVKEVFDNKDEAKNWNIKEVGLEVTNSMKEIESGDGGQGGVDKLPNTGNIHIIDQLYIASAVVLIIGFAGLIFIAKARREEVA